MFELETVVERTPAGEYRFDCDTCTTPVVELTCTVFVSEIGLGEVCCEDCIAWMRTNRSHRRQVPYDTKTCYLAWDGPPG